VTAAAVIKKTARRPALWYNVHMDDTRRKDLRWEDILEELIARGFIEAHVHTSPEACGTMFTCTHREDPCETELT